MLLYQTPQPPSLSSYLLSHSLSLSLSLLNLSTLSIYLYLPLLSHTIALLSLYSRSLSIISLFYLLYLSLHLSSIYLPLFSLSTSLSSISLSLYSLCPPLPGLRKHDVCFLVTVRPNLPYGTRFDRRQPFVEQTGLVYVRGCEVQGMLDDKGRVIEEGACSPQSSHIHSRIHSYIQYCTCKYECIHIQAYICTDRQAHIHMYMHTYILCFFSRRLFNQSLTRQVN